MIIINLISSRQEKSKIEKGIFELIDLKLE